MSNFICTVHMSVYFDLVYTYSVKWSGGRPNLTTLKIILSYPELNHRELFSSRNELKLLVFIYVHVVSKFEETSQKIFCGSKTPLEAQDDITSWGSTISSFLKPQHGAYA